MGCVCIHISDSIGGCRDVDDDQEAILAGDRVEWLRRLLDASRHTGDTKVHHDGQQRGEKSSERVVHATVLVDLNDLVDQPTDEVHPRQRRGEREASHDGVQGLRFEFLADERNSFSGGRHFIYYS